VDVYPIKFIYNVSQIFICAHMTVDAGLLIYRYGHSTIPDSTEQPLSFLIWLFYISKAWDFMDTVFIVLEKRQRQLSFLHVYHHAGTFLLYWFNANVIYDGDILSINYVTLVMNGAIHTIMYTYYFICMHTKDSVTGKSLPIWWKSSLTALQLLQFVIMMSLSSYSLKTSSDVGTFRVAAVNFVYICSLFILFVRFYAQTYNNKMSKGATKKSI